MNKLFCYLIFFPLSLFSQNFDFDYMSLYSRTKQIQLPDEIIYSNSKDDSYYLKVAKDKNQEYYAQLFDFTNFKVHHFNATSGYGKGFDFYFEYEFSDDLKPRRAHYRDMDYDLVYTEYTTDSTLFQMTIYKNKRRKHKLLELKGLLLKSEQNLTSILRFQLGDFHDNNHITVPGNHYITIAQEIRPYYAILYQLKELKKVKFQIQMNKVKHQYQAKVIAPK